MAEKGDRLVSKYGMHHVVISSEMEDTLEWVTTKREGGDVREFALPDFRPWVEEYHGEWRGPSVIR